MERITNIFGATADEIGVERFAQVMRLKLAKKRQQGKSGWNLTPQNGYGCTVKQLEKMLADHVKKGDVVDVANFCMMIWNRKNPNGIDAERKPA